VLKEMNRFVTLLSCREKGEK